MNLNSRTLALLISLAVALVLTAFLALATYFSSQGLFVALIIVFISCFVLVHFSYQALVFREVKNVYSSLEKLKRQDFKKAESRSTFTTDPLRKIKDDIYQIAERKQQEIDELKQLQAMRREFLADVSHELKTPIFAAQGFIHTLLDGAMDDPNVRERFLLKAAKSLDGLDALVQDLISISQFEKGVVKMQKRNFDVVQLVREVFEQLEQKAAQHEVTLHVEAEPGEAIMLYADPNRIRQVFVNLTDNAIKYGRRGGNIWVYFDEGRKKYTITVKDDGKGIGQEHINRIFERFYRIDKSRARDTTSTGLGLAICKHIIEAHRSLIAVKSEVGKGTTLRFKLLKAKKD
ncbi:two-component system phosphate regulon sensor histidine kinase PhoR [Pontibacter ummariensis]|uniref:histidine kinase n=1 Tax=Pontibacter ummariensis TaxID=1610492 RepID=A0A239B4H4_9BACT|nr:ATP-binding protein [Pontibacter ummariensis]PRY16262.1 two-component system phosphate regulon sensor histidine kinase PhoR [Pontibacter ummariensis]SNS02103.1 two-component system, OmpR family, phosphate regulon sensor histidine kinase PhoR [Pontibacter ummariensis]